MKPGTIHLDITQLLIDPRRTGIQRVERELIRHWPGPATLAPCRFNAATGRLHALAPHLLTLLRDDSPEGGTAAEHARLAPHVKDGAPVRPKKLLCAELFSDPARAAYYIARAGQPGLHWLVYDFLPWLHPERFHRGAPTALMPYLRALRGIPSLAFISAATKRDYVTRISRHPNDGPVVPLGGDGLGLEPQHFTPDRRDFVMLGTIEPRKNVLPAIEAFQRLWSEGVDARLTLIGTPATDAPELLATLARLEGNPRLHLAGHLNDEAVRARLRQARALLFPSTAEGYGIPPMEALHAGIPVIVSTHLPALEDRPSHGQLRLPEITPATIAAAIRHLLDDQAAAHLWHAAPAYPTQHWSTFAHQLATWLHP